MVTNESWHYAAFPKAKDWGQQKWENSIFCTRRTFYDSLHMLHLAFGKYHQRAALAVDYAKVAAQSKAMFLYNVFIKINVHVLYSTAT